MSKIEILIDGEKKLERELKSVEGSEVIRTIDMILNYAELHKGSKIKMLKGLQGLR